MTSIFRRYSKKIIESEISKANVQDDKSDITEENLTLSQLEERKIRKEISIVSEIDLKGVLEEYMGGPTTKVYSPLGILPESLYLTKPDVVMDSDMVTSMLGCIVRYAGDELKLIQTKYSNAKVEVFYNSDDLTLEEKCTKPLFELHDYPTYLLGENEMAYSFYKFEVDKCFITKLLMNMARAIMKKKSYSGFLIILEKVLNSKHEEDTYLNESFENKTEINNIGKTVYEERTFNKIAMDGIDAQLTSYKNMFEDIKRENVIKEEYIDKWELSRNRQSQVMYKQKIGKLEREIKEYRSKIERENRVNEEVERYTNMVHVDTEEELKTWSKRYNSELEQKEYEIQNLKEMTLTTSDELAVLKVEFEHQSKGIEEGRALRKELMLRKNLTACQERAAIKIQAWWRGVRVRRGISLKKKKKKKRSGKKDEKKGGGKKDEKKGKGAAVKRKK